VETIIGGKLQDRSELEIVEQQVTEFAGGTRYTGLLRIKSREVELPSILLQPKNWNGRAGIWLSEQGKAALFGDGGWIAADVKRLLDAGAAVFGVDLLFQGE